MSRVTFQGLILKLQNFWAERGCIIETPMDLEVGAGTMHPATYLRVLGPEPWNVAYVQPSRRPADGRYGDNPFRLGKHYQFQVILKPSPLEVQELYLDSLRALGLDLTRHDIRFRSEERRVGKECRSRWSAYQQKKHERSYTPAATRRRHD